MILDAICLDREYFLPNVDTHNWINFAIAELKI